MFYFCSVFRLSHAVCTQRKVILQLGIWSHTVIQDYCIVPSKQNLGKLHQLANKFGLVTQNLKRKGAYAGQKDRVDNYQNQKRRSSKFVKNSTEA